MSLPCLILIIVEMAHYTETSQSICNNSNTLNNLKQINWEKIGQNTNNTPNINVSVDVIHASLTLNIKANLEYLGIFVIFDTFLIYHNYNKVIYMIFRREYCRWNKWIWYHLCFRF